MGFRALYTAFVGQISKAIVVCKFMVMFYISVHFKSFNVIASLLLEGALSQFNGIYFWHCARLSASILQPEFGFGYLNFSYNQTYLANFFGVNYTDLS